MTTQEILDRIDMAELLDQMGFDDVNRSSSTYLGFCIFHDDLNTKSFYANHTSKTFKCFGACNKRGNAIQLYAWWKNISVDAAKVELSQLETSRSLDSLSRQLEIKDTLPLWRKFELLSTYVNRMPVITQTPLKSYMNKRGISDETLELSGVRAWKEDSFDEHEVASYIELGIFSRKDTTIVDRFGAYPVLFPYWDVSKRTVTFLQGRMVEHSEDRPKYLGTRGVVTHCYNHHVLYFEKDTVYICEGVIDALSMVELGYPSSVGIPGVSSFKPAWLDDFHCRRVVLALDNDPAGEEGCKSLTEIISRRGIEVVRFTDHQGFKDVNEFLIAKRNVV